MAATISSYFHPIFRSHLPNSNKSFDSSVEISYSYSELPALGHRSLELGGVGRKEVLAAKSLERVKKTVFGNAKRKSNDDLKRQTYPSEVDNTGGRHCDLGVNSLGSDRKLSRSRLLLFQNSSVINSRTGEASRRKSNESESSSTGSNVEKVKRRLEEQLSHEQKKTSFEPPPRRRLADSIFASFKLPKKKSVDSGSEIEKMASQTRGISCSNTSVYQNKRKSAVELLAETKAFYVKSETVLDRKQELPLRLSAGLGQAIAAGGCVPVNSNTIGTGFSGPYIGGNPAPCATSRNRSSSGGGQSVGPARADGLQSTLRRLLQHTDSRESLQQPVYAVPVRKSCRESHKSRESLHSRSSAVSGSGAPPSGASGTSSGTSGSKHCHKSEPDNSRGSNSPMCHYSGRADSADEARVFFPDSFVVPCARPAETPEVFKNTFSMGSSLSSPEDGVCLDLDYYTTISPPAQYALTDRAGYRYIRSNSHSQPQSKCEEEPNNITGHKSLPDLHSQAHCFVENDAAVHEESVSWSRRACSGTAARRRRRANRHDDNDRDHDHDPPSNSYSSKGTRSNRSSIVSSCEGFPDHRSQGGEYTYNRSGSSFARDSGGSSGHYTQRSAPASTAPLYAPHAPPRRDSGASTQHTSEQLRYITYYPADVEMGIQHSPERGGAWPVSAPLQFQDGIPSPPHPPAPPANYQNTLVGIHFQASIPPPQFQDDPHPVYGFLEPNIGYQQTLYYGQTVPKCRPAASQVPPLPPAPPRTTKEGYPAPGQDCDYYDASSQYPDTPEADYRFINQVRYDGVGAAAENDPNHCQAPPDRTPGAPPEALGVFRRQRCLRYKRPAAQRRPILRSKSDVSDRNWRSDFQSQGPASNGPSVPTAKCRSAVLPDTHTNAHTLSQDTPQVHNLDRFFERLGLDDSSYNAIVKTPIRRSTSVRKRSSEALPDNISINKDLDREYIDSPVFFSDVSTVDSNQIANNADFTVQGAPQSNTYRSNEPPSIVERNARIIKWLCNCRKLQLATQ